jgi:hypothetical protein
MFRKYAGDDIALTFQKLLDKKIEKKASYESEDKMMNNAEDKMEDCVDCGDMASMAEDILSSQVSDSQDSLLEEEMSMLDEHTKEARIMRGLGKIAASLKSKGEYFASDVVEATARSIQGDFKKEAAKKRIVQTELQKLARNMRISGKSFGADLVESSIRKIKNS